MLEIGFPILGAFKTRRTNIIMYNCYICFVFLLKRIKIIFLCKCSFILLPYLILSSFLVCFLRLYAASFRCLITLFFLSMLLLQNGLKALLLILQFNLSKSILELINICLFINVHIKTLLRYGLFVNFIFYDLADKLFITIN